MYHILLTFHAFLLADISCFFTFWENFWVNQKIVSQQFVVCSITLFWVLIHIFLRAFKTIFTFFVTKQSYIMSENTLDLEKKVDYYSREQLEEMKMQYLWRNCLNLNLVDDVDDSEGGRLYYLYPTGAATFSGRIHIAIPQGQKITKEFCRDHNLLVPMSFMIRE
jgi:hypothetical protein